MLNYDNKSLSHMSLIRTPYAAPYDTILGIFSLNCFLWGAVLPYTVYLTPVAYKKKVSQRLGKGSVFLFYRTFWNLFFELFARGRVRNLFSKRFGKGSGLR